MAESETNTAPWLEPDYPRADARDAFSAHTAATPLPEGARDAFLASKLRVLRTHPMSPSERTKRVQDFLYSMHLDAPLTESLPGGGGVGYGVFYDPSFKVAFQTGTGLAWGIVFSTPPGGNVLTWLYLTGMNRASMGAEAFIAYNGQNDISFNVFDWAVRQWQIHRPLATMGQYVGSITANGSEFPVVQLANLTYQNGPTSWVNEVQILNQSTRTLDVAYRNEYSATLEQQTDSYIGSWAAELETFQATYQGTNPMGCSNAMFAITDGNGAWSQWTLLSPADASPRQDDNGFHTLFVNPAYSWAVSS